MSSISTGYDLAANQFSPDGRIFQIEYAQKAAQKSSIAIGLRGKDCVVFAVEKPIASKLYEEHTNKRIFTINKNIGMASAGYFPDALHLLRTAKVEAADFKQQYQIDISLKSLTSRVANYVHAHTLYGALRPFGVCIMMGTYDLNGPRLVCIDPTGAVCGYFGCAIGKGSEATKTEIGNLNLKDLTCEELVREAARVIYIVHEDSGDKKFGLELSWVGKVTRGKHLEVPKELFEEAENYAKSVIEENDYDDDL